MRVSRLNKDKLQEIRRKRYLNELVDLCLYGECLQEETAREYFLWLLPRVLEKLPETWYEEPDVDKDGNSQICDDKFKNYDKLNNTDKEKLLAKYGTKRFLTCKDLQGNSKGIVNNYFDGNFKKFKNDLKSTFAEINNQARKQKMDLTSLKKVQDCFKYYCSLFVKDIEFGNNFSPSPYLSVKSKWTDKYSSKPMFDNKHRINNLKGGESWEATPDPKWKNPKKELEDYYKAS